MSHTTLDLSPPVQGSGTESHLITSTNSASNSIAMLDGLRGIAVLMTVAYHLLLNLERQHLLSAAGQATLDQFMPIWAFGYSGVPLFFILSGFLLFRPYAHAILNRTPLPSVRKFYTRRALRILPGYWASLIAMGLLTLIGLGTIPSGTDVLLHIGMVYNFNDDTFGSINGPYWTLALEWQFYLILPLLGWLVWVAWRHKRMGVLVLFGCAILASAPLCGLFQTVIMWYFPSISNHLPIGFTFGFLTVFGSGALCSFAYVAITEGHLRRLSEKRIHLFTRLAGSLGLIYLTADIIILSQDRYPVEIFSMVYWFLIIPLLGIGFGLILLALLFGWRKWAGVLAHPALRFIGVISYSIYIWNEWLYLYIILPIAGLFPQDWLIFLVTVVLAIVIIVPFSWLSYRLVERPFIGVRQAQRDKSIP